MAFVDPCSTLHRVRRSTALVSLAGCLAIASLSTSARADAPARALLRRLGLGSSPHALTVNDGRIPVLAAIPPGQTASSLGLFEVAPGVGAKRLRPAELEAFAAAQPSLSLFTGPEKQLQLDRSGSWTGAVNFRLDTGLSGKGVVVGIIDSGIDTTHPGFLDEEGKTRIAWLLTSGAPRGVHAAIEEAAGCSRADMPQCSVYSAEDITELSPSKLRPDMRDTVGHGTHVASIAAGTGATGTDAGARYIGVAPGATLVVAAPSESGGFSDDDVLRAASFVFARADELGLPCVLNISIGGDFGAHDGTGLMERGLAALVGDDKPGRVIVVSSGNSGGLYRVGDYDPVGIHTEVRVDPHAPASVPLITPGSDEGRIFVWASFRPGDEVSVGLEGPDGTWISPVSPGDDAGYDDGEGTTAAIINNVVDGRSSISADSNSAVMVWAGKWDEGGPFRIRLEGRGDASLWVAARGEAGVRGAFLARGLTQGTINLPASHPRLLAVGATLNRNSWRPYEGDMVALGAFGPLEEPLEDSVAYFSASGPTPLGVPKPEIVAPGAFIGAALSVDADPRLYEGSMFEGAGCPDDQQCYVLSERYAIASGTSMSSPQVAGAVALLLEHDPTLTQAQVTDILQASARKPVGTIALESQMGPGSLDLRHMLEVAGDELPQAGPVDRAASWWVLSSETARPDPSWPVWGTIELRREGGKIATGLDGSLLQLEVDGGAVLSPVTKVRHGLFRFSIAGRRGTGGSAMRVRVLYDGQPIGETRLVPIGVDAFAARGGYGADGGWVCSASPGSAHRGEGAAFVAALAAGFVGARSARRRRGPLVAR